MPKHLLWTAAAMSAALIAGCADTLPDADTTATTPAPTPTPSPTPTPTATVAAISSVGADGWAATGTGTTGGQGAVAAKTYTVANRNDLIQALYGGTATINADGSYSGTLDPSPKIITVSGTISLNVDKSLTEYTADSYIKGSCASTQYGFATEAALTTAYVAAYRPSVYGNANLPTGAPESARVCAANLQKSVVQMFVPSNTSIIGARTGGKITHGNLILGTSSANIDNVVIRNLGFEDSFDFFPQWDPTDSTTGRWNSAYDLVSVLYATHVWVDHDTFSDGTRTDNLYPSVYNETVNGVDYRGVDFKVQHHDGLVDVTKIGNLVTVSNSYFSNHDKSFLIGGTDTASTTAENPRALKVTFHDNYFLNLRQRMPRVRFGQVHVYNNYYEGTLDTTAPEPFLVGWTVGQAGKIVAENNVFQIASSGAPATVSNLFSTSITTSRVATCAALGFTTDECSASFGDTGTVLNGAAVDVTTPLLAANVGKVARATFRPGDFYGYQARSSDQVKAAVLANAGAGKL